MPKIYTKTGDKRKTAIRDGKRVWKDDSRIEALGVIDELNSILGICRAFTKSKKMKNIILNIQNDVFLIQAQISGFDKKLKIYKIKNIEKLIDEFSKGLKFDKFIIPGETKESALLDFARAICRRAERRIVGSSAPHYKEILKYLNRLSDFLYILARYVNKNKKEKFPKY